MAPTLPTLTVQAGFGATGGTITYTDISAYVRTGTITRATSRLAGPLYQYQPATCTLVLKNGDGRFDPDNLAGPYVSVSGTQTVTQTFTSSGTWTAPAGLTAIDKVECWGGGGGGGNDPSGGGNDGGGGGGGEYASATAVAVSALAAYSYTIGAAGVGGAASSGSANAGTGGGTTTFPGNSVSVVAHGGGGGSAGAAGGGAAGAGGTGSTNTTHHDGGAGAAGISTRAGGGGGGAGPAAAGNAASGASGGAAVTGGGPGGNGGAGGTSQNGMSPASGPAGAGGGGNSVSGNAKGGNGWGGQIVITYTVTVPAAATTAVIPMTPIRVQATFSAVTYTLFTGYATSWADAGLNNPRYAETTLNATDGQYILANVNLAALVAPVGANEDTGTRVSRILDAAGWPASQRNITPGDSILQSTSFGDIALSLIQTATDTEAGEFYLDGSGNAVFRHRQAILTDTRSTVVQVVLGDSPGTVETDGTERPYTVIMRATDDTTLTNDVQNTRVGGTLQEATDATSVSKYLFPRTYQRSDLLNVSDPDALNWAQWVLHIGDTAEDRIDTITITPQRDPTNLYPQALGREIGDLAEVWRRPPGVAAFSKVCFIRGIAHTWDQQSWQTSWTLQDASKYGSFFTLDDTVRGKLDFNALAY